MFAAPGQCPASDFPPLFLQDCVAMHMPFVPLLIVHFGALAEGFGGGDTEGGLPEFPEPGPFEPLPLINTTQNPGPLTRGRVCGKTY